MKPAKGNITAAVQRPQRSGASDPEPSVGHADLPVWIFVALSLVLFGVFVYLDKHAGGFHPGIVRAFQSTNQVAKLTPEDPTKKDFFAGMAVYSRTCLPCHQPSGAGLAGQFPPLVGSEWVLNQDPGHVIRIVLDGLQGPIMVKGQPWNAVMVRWKDVLSDKEVAQVATYVRQAWGNSATAVTPEAVAKIREETASRSAAWTADELLKIAPVQ